MKRGGDARTRMPHLIDAIEVSQCALFKSSSSSVMELII